MIRPLAISLVLLAAACSASPRAGESPAEKSARPSVLRQPDNLCINDCLGSGGDRQFCEDRCTD